MTPNAKACLIDDGGRLWDVPPHRATAAAQRDLRVETAGRYWIHEKIPHRRSFAITEAGPSLRIPDPNYTTQLRGTDITALPDAGYGRWVLQDFMRAAQTGQPTYDEISAHMFWPETGVIERRYRRLLLPWLNAKGRVVLTSAITSL